MKDYEFRLPKCLFICDFGIENPPDFMVEQIKLAANYGIVWVLARRTRNSNLGLYNSRIHLLEFRESKIDYLLFRPFRRFKLAQNFSVIFKPHAIAKVLYQLIKIRPNMVHIHGLGDRMAPVSIIPIISYTSTVKVVVTHHGFSVLNGGLKLYPADIKSRIYLENHEDEFDASSRKSLLTNYELRKSSKSSCVQRFVATLINSASTNITLCPMQSKIFRQFRIRVDLEIPNFCNPCECDNFADEITLERRASSEIRLLFIGRPIGKGLERIVNLTKNTPNAHLYLAGYVESQQYVQRSGLDSSQFTFLGYLEKKRLYKIMHRMHFVTCLSDCYDTFPTVVLEALSHGSVPLITPSTGVVDLLLKIDHRMVWPGHSDNDARLLREVVAARNQILFAIRASNFEGNFKESLHKLDNLYGKYLT